MTEYNKVRRNLERLAKEKGIKIIHPSKDFKIELANELAAIAESYGIEMYSCCGDYLVGGNIKKAHCIDGALIEELFSPPGFSYKLKPTRKECGCTESTDIGAYDTCPHGCVYCYANVNKFKAYQAYRNHHKDSAFLGVSVSQSKRFIAEIRNSQPERYCKQLELSWD